MPKTPMSDEHKAALAKGRTESKAVREYLQALEQTSRRGRKVSPDKLRERISAAEAAIANEPDPAKRLDLIQKRLNDEDRLASADAEVDMDALEKAFIDAAAGYSERNGISYTAWRELGVPAPVLKAAGVQRTRRTA